MLVGYLENIISDRKLMQHCAMRMDILFFLGYNIDEPLPWHSTLSRMIFSQQLLRRFFCLMILSHKARRLLRKVSVRWIGQKMTPQRHGYSSGENYAFLDNRE